MSGKTRRQVERWARQHMPEHLEQYRDELVDWLVPRRRRRWDLVVMLGVVMLVAMAGAALVALAPTYRDPE